MTSPLSLQEGCHHVHTRGTMILLVATNPDSHTDFQLLCYSVAYLGVEKPINSMEGNILVAIMWLYWYSEVVTSPPL